MAVLFIELLCTEEVISNYIIEKTKRNSYSEEKIEEAVCLLLNIKSVLELREIKKKFESFICKLTNKNIFN